MINYDLKISRFVLPELAGIRWCIDNPISSESYSAEQLKQGMIFSGWLLLPQTSSPELFIRQGDVTQLFSTERPRPDVLKHLLIDDQQPEQLLCGFRQTVKWQHDVIEFGIVLNEKPLVLARLAVAGNIQVLKGHEGWLFLDNDNNRSVEQFTGKKLLGWSERRNWQRYANNLQQFANRQQLPYALLIAPSKESVYSDFYPYTRGKKTIIKQLLKLLPVGFTLIYPTELLRQSDHRSYKLTDTHWSTYGARIATECLATELAVDATLLQQVFARDHYYYSSVVGDLGNKVYPPAEAKEAFLDNYHYLKKRTYDNGLPNFGRVQVFENDAAIDPGHCLIFGSSSSYSMLGYLTRIFKKLTLIHSAGNIDTELVKLLAPHYLVAQTNERFAVRSPLVGYSVAQSIATKLAGLSDKDIAVKEAEICQKYPVAGDEALCHLHALYSKTA